MPECISLVWPSAKQVELKSLWSSCWWPSLNPRTDGNSHVDATITSSTSSTSVIIITIIRQQWATLPCKKHEEEDAKVGPILWFLLLTETLIESPLRNCGIALNHCWLAADAETPLQVSQFYAVAQEQQHTSVEVHNQHCVGIYKVSLLCETLSFGPVTHSLLKSKLLLLLFQYCHVELSLVSRVHPKLASHSVFLNSFLQMSPSPQSVLVKSEWNNALQICNYTRGHQGSAGPQGGKILMERVTPNNYVVAWCA